MKHDEFTTTRMAVAAGVVGVLWFAATGAVWQFIPIIAACAILGLVRAAMVKDDKK